MENTAISKAQQFADGMAHSLAIYRAIEESNKNPDASQLLEVIIISLAEQANPAEA